MDERLERILEFELLNVSRIYLFFVPSLKGWVAYEQSAVNLCSLLPELKETLTEELFLESELRLRRVSIDKNHIEKHALVFLRRLMEYKDIILSAEVPVNSNLMPDSQLSLCRKLSNHEKINEE